MTRKERRAWHALIDWGRAIQKASEANNARELAEGRRKETPALPKAEQEAARAAEQEADEAVGEAGNALWQAMDELPLKLALCENPIWSLAATINAAQTVGMAYDNDSFFDWISYKEDELYTAIESLLAVSYKATYQSTGQEGRNAKAN